MKAHLRFGWVLVAGMLTACPDQSSMPEDLAMQPAAGRDDLAVQVVVRGTFLLSHVKVNYQSPSESTVSQVVQILLGDTPLVDVVRTDAQTHAMCGDAPSCVQAMIPAGLAPDTYDLVVVDPEGQRTVLPAAYRVMAPKDRVAALVFAPVEDQRAGVAFAGQVTALDADEARIPNLDADLEISSPHEAQAASVKMRGGQFEGELTLTVAVDATHLEARLGDVVGTSPSFAVRAGPADRLRLAGPTELPAGECVGPFPLTTTDPFGNPSGVEAETTVSVSGDGPISFAVFTDAACETAAGEVTLPAGQSEGAFFARGQMVGPVTLRADAAGFDGASLSAEVVAGPPHRLELVGAPESLEAGACSDAMQLNLRDTFDNAALPSEALTVSWTASDGSLEVFTDAGCGVPLTAVPWDAGANQTTLYIRSTQVGPVTFELSAPSIVGAQASLSIVPAAPAGLRLSPSTLSVAAGECSPALTLATFDPFGNPSGPATAQTVQLTATPSEGFEFFEDASCARPQATPSVPTSGATAVFVLGTQAGEIALRARATGLDDATQQTTISAGPAARLAFVAPPASAEVGQCVPLTIQREDAFGNPAIATETSTLTVEVTGAEALIYADSGCTRPASETPMAPSESAAQVWLRGTFVESADLVARAAGVTSASASVALTEGPADRLTLSAEPITAVAGDCAGPLVVGRIDAFGNPVVDAATMQANLTSSGSLGFFSDAGCTSAASTVDISPGSASASVYFSSQLAQQADLSASAANVTAATRPITVVAAPASRVVFSSAGVTVVAGDCSSALDLVVEDAFGNPAAGAADRTVSLSANPSAGFLFYRDAACAQSVTGVTVPTAGSAARFYVRGTVAGAVTVAASSAGLTGSDQLQQVQPGLPTQLEISSAAMTVNAGDCSGAMRITMRDAFGNLAPSGSLTTVLLATAPAGRLSFFSDASCSTALAQLALPAATTEGAVYFTAATTGSVDVTVSATGLASDQQRHQIDPAAPRRLVFLTSPQTVTAGACSGAVQIETRDVFGNRTPLTTGQSLTMSAAPSAGAGFYSDPACASPSSSFAVAAGQSRQTLYFRHTLAGAATITAAMPGLSDAAQAQTIDPAAASALVFATSASPLVAGVCSGPVRVEPRDAFGNPSSAATNRPLALSGLPSAGFTAYADASCAGAVTSVTLGAGASSSTFYVANTRAGSFDLQVSGPGLGAVSQAWSASAAAPANVAFTSAAPSGEAGACLGPLGLQLRDAFGNPSAAVGARLVNLSGPSGASFFTDASCASAATSVSLAAGQATGAAYVRGTLAGSGTITAQSSGLGDGTLALTVVAAVPSDLQFTSAPQSVAAGACSAAVSIRTEDRFGNLSAARSPRTLALAATPSSGFTFFSDAACATSVSSVPLPTGQSAASFYFSATPAGSVDVAVSSAGLTGASQTQTITAAAPSVLTFVSAPQTRSAGQCSAPVDLQIRDAFGNPATQATSRTVTLTPTPGAGLILYADSTCASVLSSATVTAGQTDVRLYFSGTRVGSPQIAATSTGLTGASQAQQIDPAPPSALTFVGAPVNLRAGACSPAFTAETIDAFDNVSPVTVGTSVNLVANPVGGLSFFVDSGCVQALNQVTISAGSSQVTLWASGTVAQPVTVGANATGLSSATALVNVIPDAPQALVITSSSHTAVAGQCSGAVVVTTEDSFGNRAAVASDAAVSLSGASVSFFADAACGTPLPSATIGAGTDQTQLYFSRQVAGSVDLTLASAGLTSAIQSQQIVPGPPAILEFVTAPQTLIAGACSAIATVRRTDSYGNPASPTTATPIGLSPTSDDDFTFYSDAGCTTSISATSIAGGADAASFYFIGTDDDDVDITAASAGLTDADQSVTVEPAPPTVLSFFTPARTFTAGTCSAAIRVQTDDAYGNRSDVAADTLVSFASTPAGLTYYDDSGCGSPVTGDTIRAGQSRAVLYVSSDVAGDLSLGVSAPGFPANSQIQTVTAAAPTQLVFTSTPQTLAAGDCSAQLTVQTQDPFGNPSGIGSDSTIRFAASPSAGLTFYEDAGCTISATDVTLSAGNTTAGFYLRSTVASAVTVTVTTVGLTDGVQAETVTAASPAVLVFTTSDQKLQVNNCSGITTVQSLDAYSNPSPPASPLTLTLTASPAVGLSYYSDAGCTSLVSTVDILAGVTTTDYYFSATVPGTYDLLASAAGLTAATQIAELRDDCGNAVGNPGETCDDGNQVNGDGCSSACLVESGFVCARFPSVCFTAVTTAVVDGSNTCPGTGTAADPYCSTASARSSGMPNIVVAPGTYASTLVFDNVTRTLVGEDGAILTPTSLHVIELWRRADVTVRGFTLRGSAADLIEVNDDARLTLWDSVLHGSATHGVHTKNNSFVEIKRTVIRNCGSEGLEVHGFGGYDVENTVLTSNGAQGVHLRRRAAGSRFVNNTVVNNGFEGVTCDNADILQNSILRDNGGGSYTGGCAVSYSALQVADGDPTNFVAACPLNATYELQAGSPCIDAGDPAGVPPAPDHDRLNESRPQGAAIDVGADEAG